MVNGEKFKWFKAQVDAADEGTTDEQKGEWLRRNVEAMQANRDEAAEQEDDDIGEALARWANEGGSLIQYDNEAYRRDFPEVTDEDE